MNNLVLVHLWLDDGCSQEGGETSVHWKPINFMVYSDIFPNLIYGAVDDYLAKITLQHEVLHEVIFSHVVDVDGAGSVLDEWFEPVNFTGEGND